MFEKNIVVAAMLMMIVILPSAKAAPVQIENNKLLIEFDENCNLTRMYNKTSSADYYHGTGKQILKLFHLKDKSTHEVELKPQIISTGQSSNGEFVNIRFTGSGIKADVEIVVSSDDAKTTWTLKLSNNGDLRIVDAMFPDIDNLYIGNDKSDDFLVRPNRYGQRIPNPSENLFRTEGEIVDGLEYQDWWNNQRLEYGGEAGMFWMDLYDADGGLYIASEDKSFIGGYLENSENNGISMALGKYIDLKKGQSITLKYAVGIHTGDWHWAADEYRKWADTVMKKAVIPRWVREMPNWYWVSSIWSMGMERPKLTYGFTFNEIGSRLFNNAICLGGKVVGMAGLEFMGHDYPLWFPEPSLGSEDDIRRVNASVNRRGGKVVPYINPIYAWEDYPNVPNSENPEFQERYKQIPSNVKQLDWDYYKDYYAMKYDGSCNYVEMHYYGNCPQMCLAAKEWQDYVLWWTHRYAEDYGFHGVQWDQLGAYSNQYCVDERHKHKNSGALTTGIIELCKRIYNDPKYKVDKDFYIWYEGASDIYSQYMHHCHSGFDLWMAWGYPEMIQYTFPHNFYAGEYFDNPTAVGEALIRNKRSIELSVLGRYKLGTGQSGEHGYKVSKLSPMIDALKGIYWYTDFKDDLGCSVPDGVWAKVLQINPEICPYVTQNGYIIPYVDVRKDKASYKVSLSGELYDLKGVLGVYWYPSFLQGSSKILRYKFDNDGNIEISLPSDTGLNAFTMDQSFCKVDNSISNVGMIVILKEDLSLIHISAPQKAKRGEDFVIRTVEQKVVGDEKSVYMDFTANNAGGGMTAIPYNDGELTPAVYSGVNCMSINGDESPYLYFKINDESFHNKDSILEVRVKYLDEGNNTFRVQYNSSDLFAMPNRFSETTADYKGSAIQYKQNSGFWKMAVFHLPDAYLAGKMNGNADIRLHAITGELAVASVEVIRKKVEEKPVPNAVVMVGNDSKKTDENGVLKYKFANNDPIGPYIIEAYKDDKSGLLPAGSVIVVD